MTQNQALLLQKASAAPGNFLFMAGQPEFCWSSDSCFCFVRAFCFWTILFSARSYSYTKAYMAELPKKRSIELCRGREWMVLSWTVTLLTLAYVFLILVLILLFTTRAYVGISVLAVG